MASIRSANNRRRKLLRRVAAIAAYNRLIDQRVSAIVERVMATRQPAMIVSGRPGLGLGARIARETALRSPS